MLCKKCEKIVKSRIKVLEDFDKGRDVDRDRDLVIQQLEYLLEESDLKIPYFY